MMIDRVKTNIGNYIKQTRGVVAIAFGLLLPVLVGSVGVTVDMAQAYLVRARLSNALDAAALAAAATGSEDENVIEDKVDDFIEANYPAGEIGVITTVEVTLVGKEITVAATARLDTSFMKVFGYEHVNVESSTTVQREVRGIEVVMVLDNTGSMNTNNNIDALKDASEAFVEILFEDIENEDAIRIGMVPYSSSVNVGPYGLGFDLDDEDYGDAFVNPPDDDRYEFYLNGYTPYSGNNYGIDEDDLEYDPTLKGQWHGCVLAEEYPLDTEDHEGPWEMYRYDFRGSTDNWYDNVYDWSPYLTYGDYYNTYYGPNYHCPDQPIVPLTSDEQVLYDAIDEMDAEGFTLGNYGMVWGWRVLSPEEPFTEGSDYDDDQWDKVVVMMTDGVNTMNHAYTAYGPTDEHSVDPDDLNDRFAETCDAMKEAGILIYTVTFYSGVDEETKDFYRECATTEANYNDAPSQEDLIEVFEKISRELSNLHIKY